MGINVYNVTPERGTMVDNDKSDETKFPSGRKEKYRLVHFCVPKLDAGRTSELIFWSEKIRFTEIKLNLRGNL